MELIEHSTTGHYVVATESGSRYLIDFDRQVFVRLPREVEDTSLTMRGDFYQVRLVRLVECVVGARMQLVIDLGVPGVAFTTRQTTTVRAIATVPAVVEGGELDTLICTLGPGNKSLERALQQLTEEEEHHGNR